MIRINKDAIPRTEQLDLELLLKTLTAPRQGVNRRGNQDSSTPGTVPIELIRLCMLLAKYKLEYLNLLDLFSARQQNLMALLHNNDVVRILRGPYYNLFQFLELVDEYGEDPSEVIEIMIRGNLHTHIEKLEEARRKNETPSELELN